VVQDLGKEIVGLYFRWGAAKRIVPAFVELVGMTDAGEAVSTNKNALTR
jgi:hypothetical protein